MKILVVTECFWPDIYAINDIVTRLVQRGHQVTVLTGLPDYTTSEIPEEYKHGKSRHQVYHGAEVFRVPTIARRHGPIWRSLSYLSYWFNGVYAAHHKKFDFDVIYVWEVSPVTMAFPAIALKKKYHKPILLYCMDIWPECVKAMGFKEHTLPYSMIHSISKKAYRGCDKIAVSSKPFFAYLNQVDQVPLEKMTYLPQYGPERMLNMDLKAEPAEDGKVRLLYIGNIGKAQGLDTLLKAIALLNTDRPYVFNIVGGGTEFESCKNLSNQLKLGEKVKFYGPIPFDQSVNMYRQADACVFTLKGDTHIGDTLPGKIQTYLAAGKPVFAACNGAGKQVIEESGCGACAPAGDVQQYASILDDFINDPEKYSNCGDNAKKYFMDHFMEDMFFEHMEKLLHELIEEKEALK